MSFLDRVDECRVFDDSAYRPFRVDGAEVGLVDDALAGLLADYAEVFRVGEGEIGFAAGLKTSSARSRAIAAVLDDLRGRGEITGWRDEPFPVAASHAAPILFTMERAAVPRFGVRAYGVHVNGIVRDGESLRMWIARRSPNKQTEPGKLDQIVAGGQPAGLGLRENLVKECAEEASIPAEIARRAVAVSAVSYCTERAEGLRRDVVFCYDLELPPDFVPENTDREVAGFDLWPIERVIEAVRDTDAFKFNCSLVIIDFLIRHGFIEPDHPDYVALVTGLRGLQA